MNELQEMLCPWCGATVEGRMRCPDCGRDMSEVIASHEAMPTGTSVSGRYVVERTIGVDTTCIRYLAADSTLQREVELAQLRGHDRAPVGEDGSDMGPSPRECAFLQEARALARVDARGLMPAVVDLFTDELGAFCVFEHHEGKSLEEVLEERGGRMTPDEADQVMAPVLSALQALHDAEFVHGELSARRVIVTKTRTYLLPALGGRFRPSGRTVAVRPTPEALAARIDGPQSDFADDVRDACALYYRMVVGVEPPTPEEVAGGFGVLSPSAAEVALDASAEQTIMRALEPSPSAKRVTLEELRLALFGAKMGMGAAGGGGAPATDATIWGAATARSGMTQARMGWVGTRDRGAVGAGRPTSRDADLRPGPAGAFPQGAVGEDVVFPGAAGSKGRAKVGRTALLVAAALAVIAVVAAVVFALRMGTGAGPADVSSVSVGTGDVVVATTEGKVLAFGGDFFGQLDVGSWDDVTQVAAGAYHTLGLGSDGSVRACGRDDLGQCDVSGWSDITGIAAGWLHSVGVRADGRCVAMGDDSSGQCETGEWEDVVAASCGAAHTVALTADGRVLAAGSDECGQCEVDDWAGIVSVCAGSQHTVGLTADGTCVATGDDSSAQCEVDSWQKVKSISCGYSHTIALTEDGHVLATGSNEYGQCEVGDWTDVVGVYAGGDCTLGLLSDGSFVSCGYAGNGQRALLQHSLEELAQPGFWVALEPEAAQPELIRCACGRGYSAYIDARGGVEVAGRLPGKDDASTWKHVVSLMAGDDFLVALTSEGECEISAADPKGLKDVSGWKGVYAVFAEGDHIVGLRSDGTCLSAGRTKPFDVSGFEDVINVALGPSHVVGLTSEGHVLAAGANDAGQLDVKAWTDVVAVAVGARHTVGLTADGHVLATGANDEGQCEVASWTGVLAIVAGARHTVGLTADGHVLATGANDEGQCDVGELKDVKAITSGPSWDRTYALLKGGVPVAVGENEEGELDLLGKTDVIEIWPGDDHTLLRFLLGGYEAVGADTSGQLEVTSWGR